MAFELIDASCTAVPYNIKYCHWGTTANTCSPIRHRYICDVIFTNLGIQYGCTLVLLLVNISRNKFDISMLSFTLSRKSQSDGMLRILANCAI